MTMTGNIGLTELLLTLVMLGLPVAVLVVVVTIVLRPIHVKLDRLIALLEKR